MAGGRLKCRYCAFRAPNPTEIQRHVEAEHPGYWRNIRQKAKIQTIGLDLPYDPKDTRRY